MIQLEILVALVSQQTTQLANELVHLSKVARPEVLIERLVYEFLYDQRCLPLTLSTLKK